MSDYQTILFEPRGRVGVITLNRPDALNALNEAMMRELAHLIDAIDQNPDLAVSVITGAGRAFAAGADIKEMQPRRFADMYGVDYFSGWDKIAAARKILIAAVNGFALGGGCELAMLCDIVLASGEAKFGQPEIKLGVTPGIGGSQRLTRAIGKAKAMDMILTGRMMDAAEAEKTGLIAEIAPAGQLMARALAKAEQIAAYSLPALMAAKEMVQVAFDMPLREGVRFERRLFHGLFGGEDQKEGMAAFLEKRPPSFRDR